MVSEKMVIDIDNLSEEGELKRSPDKQNFSDDDADTQDSLEIKPPQAVVHHKKSSSHRRDKHSERTSERRDKEYKSSRHHDDRHHREKHRESRYRRHEPDQYEKTRRSEPTKRDRDSSRYERKERSTGDRVLEDLRERDIGYTSHNQNTRMTDRLLDKRRERRDDSRDYKLESSRSGESRREESSSHRRVVITAEDPREQQQLQRGSNGRHSMRHSDPNREKRHKRSHKHERTRDREKEMTEREIARRAKHLREQQEEDEQPMEVDDYDDPPQIEPEHHHYHQQSLPPPKDPKDMTEQELRRQRLIDAEREMALMKKNSHMALEARRQKRGGEKRSHSSDDETLDPSVVHLSEDESEEKTDHSSSVRVSSGDRSEDSSDDSSSSTDTDESTESRSTRSRSESEHLGSPAEKSDVPPSPEPIPEENKSNGVVKEEEKEEVEPEVELPPYFPAIQGCRNVEEYKCLNRIAEGTYGVVYRAEDKRTKEIVALKRLKMEKEKEGFPITSLREINTLLKAQHPNIVTVREIVVGSNMDKIFIVMDFIEHDLKSLMETMKSKNQVFIPGEVKCLMQQLLKAVSHLHDNWILHRDLKTSNLLLSHKGILKVGDFGLAREYGSPLKRYTSIVVTLWYRAPELLLGSKEYSTPVDMWSVGCIFAELLRMEALFPGKSETDLLNRVFKELGTPNDKVWPGYSELPLAKKMVFAHYPVNNLRQRFGMTLTELGYSLLNKLLTYDPKQRITAEDAIKHDYFAESPLPIDPSMFPTWPAKSEFGLRTTNASPKPPSGGKEFKQLGDDEDNAIGFHMGSREASRQLPVGGGFHLKF